MSKKELTPSEYEEMVSTGKAKATPNPNYMKYGIVAVVALVLCGISFGLGMNYQKGKQTTASTSNTNDNGQVPTQGGGPGGFGGGQGRFGNGQRPNIGEVTAVSSDSITISSQQSGSDQTFKVTSSTTVQDNGSTASMSDIKKGDTVLIITGSSDTSTATQIMLNPSFGPPGGGNTQGSPASPETGQDTQSI